MADKNKSATARIAFTLPISCQICLGKVKQPVVCANHHVFCGPCMDVWLDRNQQCPTCRCSITADAPAKKILGGLSQSETADDSFRNKQLRRSRVELLFKEYEDEFEKLQKELEAFKQENVMLKKQVAADAERKAKQQEAEKTSKEEMASDVNVLMMLTKKLHELQTLYDRTKENAVALKKENTALKDEQANAHRESQRLRLELTNRSPRKYGRITAAALETKLDSSEKQIQQLQKALECSDVYVEEAQKELSVYKQTLERIELCSTCSRLLKNPKLKLNNRTSHVKSAKPCASPVFSDLGSKVSIPANGKKTPSSPVSSVSFYGKRPSSSVKQTSKNPFKEPETCKVPKSRSMLETSVNKVQQNPRSDTSFELDMPSPVMSDSETTSPNKSLNLNSSVDFTGNSSVDDTFTVKAESPTVESCCKKLKFDDNQDKKPCIKQETPQPCTSSDVNKMVTFSDSVDERDRAKNAQAGGKVTEKIKQSVTDSLTFSSPESSDDELDPNMSMTSDIAECMRLLDEAEKKVDSRKDVGADPSSSKWKGQPLLSAAQIKTEVPSPASTPALPSGLPSVGSLLQSAEFPYPSGLSNTNTTAPTASAGYAQSYQANAPQLAAGPSGIPQHLSADLMRKFPQGGAQSYIGDGSGANVPAEFTSNSMRSGLVGGQASTSSAHPGPSGIRPSMAGPIGPGGIHAGMGRGTMSSSIAHPGAGGIHANMGVDPATTGAVRPGPGSLHVSMGAGPASMGVTQPGPGGIHSSIGGGPTSTGVTYPGPNGSLTSMGSGPMNTGIAQPSTGGVRTSMAGAPMSTGGAQPSTGGIQTRMGGAPMSTGSAVPSTGSIHTSMGGGPMNAGSAQPSTVGILASMGIGLTSTGGAQPSAVRMHTGIGGGSLVTAGAQASTGGMHTSMGGGLTSTGVAQPGVGSSSTNIGGNPSGAGGPLPGIESIRPSSLSSQPSTAAVHPSIGRGLTSTGGIQPSMAGAPSSMGSFQSGHAGAGNIHPSGIGADSSMGGIQIKMEGTASHPGTGQGHPNAGSSQQFGSSNLASTGGESMIGAHSSVQNDDSLKQGITSILARHSQHLVVNSAANPMLTTANPQSTPASNMAQFDLACGSNTNFLNRQQSASSFGSSYAGVEHGNGDVLYQRRPASTDALERMLNRVSSLETEVRPASVPLPPPMYSQNKSNFGSGMLPSFDSKSGSFWSDQLRFSSSGMTMPMDVTPSNVPSTLSVTTSSTALPSLSSIFQKSRPLADFTGEKSAGQLNSGMQSTLLNGHMNTPGAALGTGLTAYSSASSIASDFMTKTTAPPVTFTSTVRSDQSLSQPLPMESGSSVYSWKSQ